MKKEVQACAVSVDLPASHDLRKEISKISDQLVAILDECPNTN